MSSLIRSWTEGSRQPACPVVVVLLYDLFLCLVTPLYFITTIMLVLTSKPAEDVWGGDHGSGGGGYTGIPEPASCARVSIIMMINFVAAWGTILMFYFKKPAICTFVSTVVLSLWCGITLGEFFSYGCTTLRFPSLPPTIRLLTYCFIYFRLVVQVIDCLWHLLVGSNFWEDNELNPELIAEEQDDRLQAAPASGSEVRAARRARRAALRRNAELQMASNTPASNLYHLGRLDSGASSPASIHLASALPPAFSLGAGSASAPAPSAVVRAVFADLRSASPASTEEFGSCCVICLGDFAVASPAAAASSAESTPLTPPGSARVFLPCCHSFHRVCIDAWFRSCMLQVKPQVCPTCRHCPTSAR